MREGEVVRLGGDAAVLEPADGGVELGAVKPLPVRVAQVSHGLASADAGQLSQVDLVEDGHEAEDAMEPGSPVS